MQFDLTYRICSSLLYNDTTPCKPHKIFCFDWYVRVQRTMLEYYVDISMVACFVQINNFYIAVIFRLHCKLSSVLNKNPLLLINMDISDYYMSRQTSKFRRTERLIKHYNEYFVCIKQIEYNLLVSSLENVYFVMCFRNVKFIHNCTNHCKVRNII